MLEVADCPITVFSVKVGVTNVDLSEAKLPITVECAPVVLAPDPITTLPTLVVADKVVVASAPITILLLMVILV